MLLRRMSSAAKEVVLRVGGVPEHFNTPWHTAINAGRFAAVGLRVEWTDFPGGTGAMTKALRNNEIDVALALTEGLVADLHKGNPSKLLGTYVSSPLTWGVHVSADSRRGSMKDLDGARYAVSRMGSGSHLMACVDAHERGVDPRRLAMEIVGSLDGARKALGEGSADVFLWEKFTTKFMVDSGEWKRIGEVPTPWPCFTIAATDAILAKEGDALLSMLSVVRDEAKSLRAAPDGPRTIGAMYSQHESDIVEWLEGVSWSAQPRVSHDTLTQVMRALVDAGVLAAEETMSPRELVSSLTTNADPGADVV